MLVSNPKKKKKRNGHHKVGDPREYYNINLTFKLLDGSL